MSNINLTTLPRRRVFKPEDFTIRGVASDILVGVGASVKNTALLGARRRRFNPSDFTVRGIASDVLVDVGSSVKNTALLGVTAVEIVNAWISIIKDLGYVTVELGEVTSVGVRELNIMLEEWRKDSNIPEEIRDFNVPMSELVEKTMKAREAKERRVKKNSEAKKELISKVNASSAEENIKKEIIRTIEEVSDEEGVSETLCKFDFSQGVG